MRPNLAKIAGAVVEVVTVADEAAVADEAVGTAGTKSLTTRRTRRCSCCKERSTPICDAWGLNGSVRTDD